MLKINSPDRQKGIIILIILSAIYAIFGLFSRYLATSLMLFQQIYLRMLAAFFVSLLIFNRQLHLSKLKKISIKEWLLIIFRAVTYYLFGVSLLTLGYLNTKYSNVSFISSLPIVAIFAIILFGEKLTRRKLIYIFLALIGTTLISVKDYSHLLEWGQGDIFALGAAVFTSLSIIARKWQTNLLNNREITTLTFFFATLLVFIASLFLGEGLPHIQWSVSIITVIIIAGFFNILGILFANYGFHFVEGILASNILTLEAFFGVLYGFLFYRELPNFKELIGGILIIISVIRMNQLEKHD